MGPGASGPTRSGGDLALGDLEPGLVVSAASALALLLLMLFDWFLGGSAWQLKWVDLLLFGLAAVTVAAAVAQAVRPEELPGQAAGLLLTLTGAIAVGVMLTLVLESTGGTVWLVLSLLVSGGILAGGLLALRPELPGGGEGRSRSARRSPGRPDTPPQSPRLFDRDEPVA